MPRSLAVYVTGHGYGHLTRCLELLRELRRLDPDVGLHLRLPYPAPAAREALGFEPDSYRELRLDWGLVQKDSLRLDLPATVRALREAFGAEGDRRVEDEARRLARLSPSAALLDLPPRAFDACRLAGVRAYGLGNFGWDWIWRDLAGTEPRLAAFADKAAEAYRACALLLRLPMSGGLESFARSEDLPLIARRSALSKPEARERLGLESGRPVVLLAYGGEGLSGTAPPPAELHRRYLFAATDPMADPGPPFRFIPHAERAARGLRYCDLIRAADIVMGKPGYGTVSECLANGAAMLWTDRGRFAESALVEDFLERRLPSARLEAADLRSGRWGPALDALAARRPFRFGGLRTDGAEAGARRILALLERPPKGS